MKRKFIKLILIGYGCRRVSIALVKFGEAGIMRNRLFGWPIMQCEIGVVGNGVVGKATALGFAQAGFQVVLLCPSESSMAVRQMSTDWDARVYALNHTAKNMLSRLKVWDALELQRITPIESMNVTEVDSQNDFGAVLSLDAYLAHRQELAWVVEDQNLNQALESAIRFAPNITRIAGTATGISADFSELTLNNEVSLRAELWVGADGAHSWLRNQAAIGFNFRSYGQRGIVTNFSCTKPHQGIAHQWFVSEQGIIALLP
ncbi:MAG: oxygenase, partial [Solimicrobium sp.]|nr:oxygenase [Solimicrobium sp.]